MTWFAALVLSAPTLFEQSVVRVLTRDFPQTQFVLTSVATKQTLGRHWASDDAIPMGSLMKPFTAIALGRDPGRARCNPKQCWLPAGHGEVGLIEAIEQSCNSFFLQKARSITPEGLSSVLKRFHLPQPDSESPGTMIGLGSGWKVQPEQLTQAYRLLLDAPDTYNILEGMRRAGRSGTAKLLGGRAAAKTGTAPCSHSQKAPGDGYVVMWYPVTAPKYMLLVQVHGVSGAEATRTAAKMLDVLRDGR